MGQNGMRTAWALQHLAFEDLGLFETTLQSRGFSVRYLEAGVDSLEDLDANAPDLLIVLGGPIGVYEVDEYPFLKQEFAWIQRRIQARKPTLGICLGAQIIAHVLGARVYQGPVKEIGFGPLQLTKDGETSYLRHLSSQKTQVLHWHGDTYDLPVGAVCLASTQAYVQQAFFGADHRILGVQFHPELNPAQIERWLIGHTVEIHKTSSASVQRLRADTQLYGPTAAKQGRLFFEEWLHLIFPGK